MNSTSPNLSAERLDQLEQYADRLSRQLNQAGRQIRLLKWAFLGTVLSCVAVVLVLFQEGILTLGDSGTTVAKTVNSKEYGLHNRDGKRVILCDYDKFGYPNMVFMDLKLNYRMGIKVWPEGDGTPGLVFYDERGVFRGNFRMGEEGETVLNLVGEGKKGGIAMKVTRDGSPSLKMTDNSGKVLFEAPTSSQ